MTEDIRTEVIENFKARVINKIKKTTMKKYEYRR